MTGTINDPYNDLFMGFENKRRPVLESVLNHHGLIIDSDHKLSTEVMRDAIISHIVQGRCV